MSRLASHLARWLGVKPGWPGHVEVGGGEVVLLRANERDPVPPILGDERLVVVSDRPWWRAGHAAAERIGRAGSSRALRARRVAAPAREAIVHDLEHASFGDVLALVRAGITRFHFVYGGGASFQLPAATALLAGLACSARRAARRALAAERGPLVISGRVLTPALPSRVAARRAVAGAIRAERSARRGERSETSRIAHYISDLASGGAQRQLVELVRAQKASGRDVAVYTVAPAAGSSAHFAAELVSLGVSVAAPSPADRLAPPRDLGPELPGWPAPLVALLHDHPARRRLGWLIHALAARPVDVLHCWLDEPNAIGALAGLASGARRVVLSTRSLSPRMSPRFAKSWYRASYRLAAHAAPTVRLVANSRAGADDYARWSGLGPGHFAVIPNGIDVRRFEPLSPLDRARARAELGVPEDAFLVVGILRFTVEKRPLDFVECVARLVARVPGARAIHVGTGPGEAAAHARAGALGLGDTLRFLGAASSPERYLAAADACLLTSEFEGCPNVVLEAQALGVPVVVTSGGGSPEVVRDGATGFVCGVGDVSAMAERLERLARDPARRAAMGAAGRHEVTERYSIAAVLARTLDLYA